MSVAVGLCEWMLARLDGPDYRGLFNRLMLALMKLPNLLCIMGRAEEAAALLTQLGATWTKSDARADELAKTDSGLRARGNTERGMLKGWSTEDLAWRLKLQYVLCTTWREVTPADVIAALPSPELLESYITNVHEKDGWSVHLRWDFVNLLLLAAEVCEKLEKPADALLYLEKVLRVSDGNDPTVDVRPTTHARGQALKGRMLIAQGKTVEAEVAFEKSVEISHRTGLRVYEMLALRDLKRSILDADGRSEEGTVRLKAVLREMKGPPAELTKLLGGGMDAEEILRS